MVNKYLLNDSPRSAEAVKEIDAAIRKFMETMNWLKSKYPDVGLGNVTCNEFIAESVFIAIYEGKIT